MVMPELSGITETPFIVMSVFCMVSVHVVVRVLAYGQKLNYLLLTLYWLILLIDYFGSDIPWQLIFGRTKIFKRVISSLASESNKTI